MSRVLLVITATGASTISFALRMISPRSLESVGSPDPAKVRWSKGSLLLAEISLKTFFGGTKRPRQEVRQAVLPSSQ